MVRKMLAILIFGGICFVFVFMGSNTFGPTTSGYAARVNNTIISIAEHNMFSNRMQENYYQLFGDQLPFKSDQIRSMALEQLIVREATAQAMEAEKLLIVPAFLRDTIVKIPVFQSNGRFQRSRYDLYLQNQRLSPARFEEKMQRDLSTSIARNFFSTHLVPTSMEVQKKWEMQNTQLNIEFVKIDPEALLSTLKVSSREISAYLQDEENLQNLETAYRNNKADYTSKTQVRVQHILIKDDVSEKTAPSQETTESDEKENALSKIRSLAEKAKTEDFSQLATQFSEDPGSKAKGGDLGYVTKGQLVPEFETAAFSLEVGQISQPVKSIFGYHLIKVLDRKDPETKLFEDIKRELAKKVLIENKIEETMVYIKEAIEKNDKKELDVFLKDLNIEKWEETGLYSLDREDIPKIGNSPHIIKATISLINQPFSLYPKVLLEGKISYLLHLKEKQLSSSSEANSDLATLKTQIQKASAQNVFDQWTESIQEDVIIEKNPMLFP